MTSTVLAAMLAAAVLHATWNAWVKSRPDPYGAIVALSIGAGLPCVLLLVWQGLPEHTAWGWIAITIALSVPAQALLGSAYREGDFVVAYPVVRGMNPVVIALGSVALFGERLSLANALGVACVSAGIALLGIAATRRGGSVSVRGLAFAGLAAIVTACAVLADSAGARATNDPIAYASLVSIGNAIAMGAYQMRRIDLPRVLVENRPILLVAPLISTASYLCTIWSIGQAPVALVISLRETSMLFAVAIGVVFLRERLSLWQGLAVAMVFAGVLLLRT